MSLFADKLDPALGRAGGVRNKDVVITKEALTPTFGIFGIHISDLLGVPPVRFQL